MRDLMLSFSYNSLADVIEAFISTSRQLNIDNTYFEQMLSQIYPTEIQLNEMFLYWSPLFGPNIVHN